jgi:hypothetical protein
MGSYGPNTFPCLWARSRGSEERGFVITWMDKHYGNPVANVFLAPSLAPVFFY